MAKISDLPQEIIDYVIDILFYIEKSCNSQALHACNHVSTSFHSRARRHLFQSVEVTIWKGEYESSQASKLLHLVQLDPSLAACIQTLKFAISTSKERLVRGRGGDKAGPLIRDVHAPLLLGLLPALKRFALDDTTFETHWSEFDKPFQQALWALHHNPSLTQLIIGSFVIVPFDWVFGWKNLTVLNIQSYFLTELHELDSPLDTSTSPQLQELSLQVIYLVDQILERLADNCSNVFSNIRSLRLSFDDTGFAEEGEKLKDLLEYSSGSLGNLFAENFLWYNSDDMNSAIQSVSQHPLKSLKNLCLEEDNFTPCIEEMAMGAIRLLAALCSSCELRSVSFVFKCLIPDDFEGQSIEEWFLNTPILSHKMWAPLDDRLSQLPSLQDVTLGLIFKGGDSPNQLCSQVCNSTAAVIRLCHFNASRILPKLYTQKGSVNMTVAAAVP